MSIYPFTNCRLCAILYLVRGALAQLVAHNTGSVGVSGSNPLCSTRTSPNRFAGSDFLHSARIRISKKREAWGATLPAQGMGDAGGGYGPSLDRGLLLHPCAGAEGFGPAGATKRLSDRPLEAFGHHTWLELLQAKMPGGSSLASQLEKIDFFQQVEGGTPALRGASWLWVTRQRLPMGRAPWMHTMRLYPWGESSRKGWERIS